MKVVAPGLSVVFMLMGAIWFLQGINVLPGSFMTGQSFWAWTGLVFMAIGATLLFTWLARRNSTR